MDGIEVCSAGTSVEAECPVSTDLLEWADRVFVMEMSQRRYLSVHFGEVLKSKRVICLKSRQLQLYAGGACDSVASEGSSAVARGSRLNSVLR